MSQLRIPTNPITLNTLLKCGTPEQQKKVQEIFTLLFSDETESKVIRKGGV